MSGKQTIKGNFIRQLINPVNVTGALFQRKPNGTYVATFYDEIPSFPVNYEIEIDENGVALEERLNFDETHPVQRIQQAMLEMDATTAKAIADMIYEGLKNGNNNDVSK